jgi:hypothetical protein
MGSEERPFGCKEQLQANFVQEHRGKKVAVNTVKRNLKQSFYLIG